MNMEQLSLDARIDATHKAVAQAEDDALGVIQRLRQIPGCEGLVSQRRSYGQCPNPWQTGNLTQQTAILRHDPPLATFLSRQAGKSLPGADPARAEAEARKQASIEALQAETERMRQQKAARQERQRQIELFGRMHEGRRVFW
jgi:hypothetical protein